MEKKKEKKYFVKRKKKEREREGGVAGVRVVRNVPLLRALRWRFTLLFESRPPAPGNCYFL